MMADVVQRAVPVNQAKGISRVAYVRLTGFDSKLTCSKHLANSAASS